MHVSHLLTDQAALGHQEVPLFEKEATPTKRSPMDKGSEPHIYGGSTCIDYKPFINFKQREHSSLRHLLCNIDTHMPEVDTTPISLPITTRTVHIPKSK